MIRRTLTRRTKAIVLVAVMYLAAWVLGLAIDVAGRLDHEVRPAQHGDIEPAPTPAGGS